jgi:hypothetical protein
MENERETLAAVGDFGPGNLQLICVAPPEGGPLEVVHLSRHEWPGTLLN